MSLVFLRGQVRYMQSRGVEVHAISSPGDELKPFEAAEGATTAAVDMPRTISPLADLRAVWAIRRELRRVRPDLVHAQTPKGGLLGTMAATLAGVPCRIYHIRGLPFMTATGRRRMLLKSTEKIACRLAHRVLCVSPSLREVAIAEGLCPPEKIAVLAGGSGNGVDADGRFNPASLEAGTRESVRQSWGVGPEELVIGFVGRLVRDKGIAELAEAFASLPAELPNVHLVVVGPREARDAVPEHVLRELERGERVHLLGSDWETPRLYAGMDVVALPTYREGFPNVPLEAAAMERPVVATRIPGCVDAVADGETGTLVPAQDAGALADALRTYLVDPELRRRHGLAGRERVLRAFRQEVIWEALHAEYLRLLNQSTGKN